MSEKIEITAFIKSIPGKSEELREAIVELIEETVKEPGCEVFKVFQTPEDSEMFVLWEVFTDQENFQHHMGKDYTKKYFSLGLTESVSATKHIEVTRELLSTT
ncbi:putative quinol monooxygenase [Marinomonas sp. RSW2]|uniref:Quinol monooxygenase n=1 Tax=Marinomonas maritima TaxID=2940935 RepID=A0ABT5WF88_9GAMM|nr:putative quinol monooxygenase [Marinomonas maritima]MDE8603484.1 putative quinol monooxygenase [Marinomonas maritima]